MLLTLAPIMLMEFQESTLVACGIGSMATLLLALRKGRPLATVLGWTLAGFGAAYYFGGLLAAKLSIPKAASAFGISATSFVWVPWVSKTLPKLLDKRAGVETDD